MTSLTRALKADTRRADSRSGSPRMPVPWWLAAATLSVLLGATLAQYGPIVAVVPFVGAMLLGAVALAYHKPSAGVVLLLIVLTIYPVGRVVLGDAPVYFQDVLTVLVLIGIARRRISWDAFGWLVSLYLLSWVPAWLYQVYHLEVWLEPTYGLVRNVLAVSTFFVGLWIANRSLSDRVLAILAVGTICTSVLAVLQAIPATDQVAKQLLTILAPEITERGYASYPARAFAFFQAPTTLSGFLAVMVALLAGSLVDVRRRLMPLVMLALAASVPALISTYSRQWAPALFVGIALLWVLSPRVNGTVIIAMGLAAASAGIVLSTPGGLDTSYLEDRFAGRAGTYENLRIRLREQSEFFNVQERGGAEAIVGRGFALRDLASRQVVDRPTGQALRQGSSENAVLREFFDHGVVAGVLYVAIVLASIVRGVIAVRGSSPAYLSGLVAALVTAAILNWSDPYFTDTVFMKGLLWLLIGWLAGLASTVQAVGRPKVAYRERLA